MMRPDGNPSARLGLARDAMKARRGLGNITADGPDRGARLRRVSPAKAAAMASRCVDRSQAGRQPARAAFAQAHPPGPRRRAGRPRASKPYVERSSAPRSDRRDDGHPRRRVTQQVKRRRRGAAQNGDDAVLSASRPPGRRQRGDDDRDARKPRRSGAAPPRQRPARRRGGLDHSPERPGPGEPKARARRVDLRARAACLAAEDDGPQSRRPRAPATATASSRLAGPSAPVRSPGGSAP
jgi:hypothetical protein